MKALPVQSSLCIDLTSFLFEFIWLSILMENIEIFIVEACEFQDI